MKRVLCLLGAHRWAAVVFVYGGWFECERCGDIR